MKWDEDKTISFVQSEEVSWNLLLQSEENLSPFCVAQQPFVSGEKQSVLRQPRKLHTGDKHKASRKTKGGLE
jgi:hypothetical protein